LLILSKRTCPESVKSIAAHQKCALSNLIGNPRLRAKIMIMRDSFVLAKRIDFAFLAILDV